MKLIHAYTANGSMPPYINASGDETTGDVRVSVRSTAGTSAGIEVPKAEALQLARSILLHYGAEK